VELCFAGGGEARLSAADDHQGLVLLSHGGIIS
jgi:hypothetical protein